MHASRKITLLGLFLVGGAAGLLYLTLAPQGPTLPRGAERASGAPDGLGAGLTQDQALASEAPSREPARIEQEEGRGSADPAAARDSFDGEVTVVVESGELRIDGVSFSEIDLSALSMEAASAIDAGIKELEGDLSYVIRRALERDGLIDVYYEDDLRWFERGGYLDETVRVLHQRDTPEGSPAGCCRVDAELFPEAHLTFDARSALRRESVLGDDLRAKRDKWIEEQYSRGSVGRVEIGSHFSAYAFTHEGLPAGSINGRLYGFM